MKTKIAAIILTVAMVTSLTLTIGVVGAVPMQGQNGLGAMIKGILQTSWVRINGQINQSGATDVRGSLYVQTRTAIRPNDNSRQYTYASAIWTTNLSRAISATASKENFTYSFYEARLWNMSVSSLNVGTDNFFLNGTWNVNAVTCNVTVITGDNGDIVSVHRSSDTQFSRVYGELTVTDSWTSFQLSLTGYDPLTGSVTRQVTRTAQFNWCKVTDDSSGTAVTKADINAVVNCFRSMPGWGNFDNRMDFNYNYRIDIADLATVAANT